MNTKSDRPRAGARYADVVAVLRQEITSQHWKVGQRLPTRAELEHRFATTTQTIQNAMDVLAEQGFIRACGRRGTFVADRLPHLTNYALVFWNDPVTPYNWSQYYMALTQAALAIERETQRKITLLHGIDQHADNEDRERLLQLMRAHRLAGMIFVNTPEYLVGTPLLDEPGIPRVAIMDRQLYANVPAVTFASPLERALDHMCARGRKRLALLSIEVNDTQDRELVRSLARRGLATPACWRQSVSRLEPVGARHCVELLLRGPAADRPDGLIIRDDNLVEHALAGLVATGLKVPDDIEVVTHCNFPWPPASVLPVKRLGFDTHDTLRRCIEIIDRQRRGETVPEVTTMPAVFEEELIAKPIAEPLNGESTNERNHQVCTTNQSA